MALDSVTKYYDKRDKGKERRYYDELDDLFRAKGRYEYIGKFIQPSWLGIVNITIDI